MGFVFKAEDLNLERSVALKVMKPHLAAKPVQKARFMREAKATAAIRNDNIVTIYEVNDDKGLPFIAMELLHGMPMDAWLAKGKKPTIQQVLRLGKQAALGLAAAHEKGLIHRDVKPANLWIEATGGGRVKLLDFGLARAAEENVNLTQSGVIVGTPAYMSPEQARGLKVDPRSDLFSLGCVLYRLVTGQAPFSGDTTMAVLTSLAVDQPRKVLESNPEVPAALADLIHKMLAKKPEDRPASAKIVANALSALEKELATGPTQMLPLPAIPINVATPVDDDATLSVSVAPQPRKRRWLRWIGITVGILIVLGIINSFVNPRGHLDIQMDDKSVELSIRMGEKTHADRTTDREFELPTGKGQLEAFDPGKESLFTIDFEIFRSQRTVLNLNDALKQRRAAPKPPAIVDGKKSFLDTLQRDDIPKEFLHPAVSGLPDKDSPVDLVAVWRVPGSNPKTRINNVFFRADGVTMITAGLDTIVLEWDLRRKSDAPTAWTKREEPQPSRIFQTDEAVFLGYAGLMYIVPLDGAKTWSISATGVLADLWTVSNSGRWIAGADSRGNIRVWDGTGKERDGFVLPGLLRSLAFHPTKDWLLVHYWHVGNPHFLKFFDLYSKNSWDGPPKDQFKPSTHPDPLPAFTADGTFVIFGNQGSPALQRYRVLDDKKDYEKKVFPPLGPFGPGIQFALSPSGKHVVVTTTDSRLHVRDIRGGHPIASITLPQVMPRTAAYPFFAPDGRHIAVAYRDLIYLYRLHPLAE